MKFFSDINNIYMVLIAVISVVLPVAGCLMYKRRDKFLEANLHVAEKFLNTRWKKIDSGFYAGTRVGVEGYYKSRKVFFIIRNGTEGTGAGWRAGLIDIKMIPNNLVKKDNQLVNFVHQPQPTKYTYVLDCEIYFDDHATLQRNGKPYSYLWGYEVADEEEFTYIFEKLTEAAEIVEIGAQYFKE